MIKAIFMLLALILFVVSILKGVNDKNKLYKMIAQNKENEELVMDKLAEFLQNDAILKEKILVVLEKLENEKKEEK